MPVNFSMSQSLEASVHVPKHAMAIIAAVGRSKSVGDPTQGALAKAVKGGIDRNKLPPSNKKGMVFYIDLYLTGEYAKPGVATSAYSVAVILFEGQYYKLHAYAEPGSNPYLYVVDKVQLLGPKAVTALLSRLYGKVEQRSKPATVPIPMDDKMPISTSQLRLPTMPQPGSPQEEIYANVG